MAFKIVKSKTTLDETRAKVLAIEPSKNDSDFESIYIALGKERARATVNKAECVGFSSCKVGKTMTFFTTKDGFVKRIQP